MRFPYDADKQREIRFNVNDKTSIQALATQAWMRLQSDGSTCVDGLVGVHNAEDVETYVIVAPHDPTHSWLIARKGWETKFEARPLECTL